MKEKIREFQEYLENEEKSRTTVEKYVRDVSRFLQFLGEKHLSKENLLFYKEKLCRCYAPASVNASLASLNSFFGFIGRYDLKMKSLKKRKKTLQAKNLKKLDVNLKLKEQQSQH